MYKGCGEVKQVLDEQEVSGSDEDLRAREACLYSFAATPQYQCFAIELIVLMVRR